MSQKAQAAVAEAKKLYGSTYSRELDCSGLVHYCYKKVGVTLPRITSQLINCGSPVSQANLEVGDLVFPSSGHVGLYSGNGKYIHVSKIGEGIKETNVISFYAGRRVA